MFTHAALVAETDSLRKFALRLTGNKADADDLLQSTFLRVLEKSAYFEEGTSLRKWASKIMFNIFATEYRRKSKFGTFYDPEPYIQAMSVGPSQESAADLVTVGAAIDRLSEDHRQVLLMVCVHDMSYEEVSSALQIPIGTVRSRLSRARAQLEGALNMQSDDRREGTSVSSVPPAYIAAQTLQAKVKIAA